MESQQTISFRSIYHTNLGRESFIATYPNADYEKLKKIYKQPIIDTIYQQLIPDLKEKNLDDVKLQQGSSYALLKSDIYAVKLVETYILSPLYGRAEVNLPWKLSKGQYKPLLFLSYRAVENAVNNMRTQFLRFKIYEWPALCFYTNKGAYFFITKYFSWYDNYNPNETLEIWLKEVKKYGVYCFRYRDNIFLENASKNFGSYAEESFLDYYGTTWYESVLLFSDISRFSSMEDHSDMADTTILKIFSHITKMLQDRNIHNIREDSLETKNGKILQIFENHSDRNELLSLLDKLVRSTLRQNNKIKEISKDIIIEGSKLYFIYKYKENNERKEIKIDLDAQRLLLGK